jgi:hypothetical protein
MAFELTLDGMLAKGLLLIKPRTFRVSRTGTPPTPDEHFDSVVALLHFNGNDAGVVFTDVIGHTFTASGQAQTDTAEKKFGVSSGLFDGTDYISSANSADWDFGTGDFTIEGWIRL